jgi:mono/diheme cytochrome c family protein
VRRARLPLALMSLMSLMSLTLCLTGCVRGCTSSRPPIHLNPNMDQQPKYQAQEASDFFYDGATMRLPIPGTVALDDAIEETAVETGKDAAGAFVPASPIPVDEALLARGAERYTIYCAPCHTDNGNGQGILFQRGKVPTADLAGEKVLPMPDGQIFDVITNGFGLMQGYRWPVSAHDRWAIVAHVKTLQAQRAGSSAASPVAAAVAP